MSPKNETCDGSLSVSDAEFQPLGNCFFCGKIAHFLCSHCQKIYYCSKVNINIYESLSHMEPVKSCKINDINSNIYQFLSWPLPLFGKMSLILHWTASQKILEMFYLDFTLNFGITPRQYWFSS